MIATLFGFNLPEAEDPAASLMWFFVGGLIAGLSLGPVASSISAARVRHIFVWGSLIFLNIASVAIEGYFFAPSLIGDALPARSAIVRASSVFLEPGEPIINTLWQKTIAFHLEFSPKIVEQARYERLTLYGLENLIQTDKALVRTKYELMD